MRRVWVRYRVKADRVHEHLGLLRAVFDGLAVSPPSGVRYAAFRLPDGVTFVHLASLEASDGSNPLERLPAFRAFVGSIGDRCEEPPVSLPLEEIGAFGFFG